MMRPNNKAKAIAEHVLKMSQRYGDSGGSLEIEEIKFKASPSQEENQDQKFKPIGDYGSFIGADTGREMKRQTRSDRLDESLGMRRGKESTKKQSYKSRRDESRGASKKKRKR